MGLKCAYLRCFTRYFDETLGLCLSHIQLYTSKVGNIFEAQKWSYNVQSNIEFVIHFFRNFFRLNIVVIFWATFFKVLVDLVINMPNNTPKFYVKIPIITEVIAILSLCTKISLDVTLFSEHPVGRYYITYIMVLEAIHKESPQKCPNMQIKITVLLYRRGA